MDHCDRVSASIGWRVDALDAELKPLTPIGAPGSDELTECPICMDAFPAHDMLSLPCKHGFCVSNWQELVSATVSQVRCFLLCIIRVVAQCVP